MKQKKNLLMMDFDKSFEPVSIDEGDEYFPIEDVELSEVIMSLSDKLYCNAIR